MRTTSGVTVPPRLRNALADVFNVTPDVIDRIRIVERSRFARLHGRRIAATTRRDVIYVAGAARRFFADPELVLHEYFHVLCQWNVGTLTVWRYLRESLRRGYRDNRFEVEARTFTRRHVLAFAARLRPTDDAARAVQGHVRPAFAGTRPADPNPEPIP